MKDGNIDSDSPVLVLKMLIVAVIDKNNILGQLYLERFSVSFILFTISKHKSPLKITLQ